MDGKMTLTLELPEEVERELAEEATRQGLSLSEYALHLLKSHTGAKEASAPQTGAELVDYWKKAGLFGTRSEIEDSQTHARKLRSEAEKSSFDQS
jgi:hypothetical protein